MNRAEILTNWTGSGSAIDDARRPRLADDHALSKWEDTTGQAAAASHNPNLYGVTVECNDTVMAAIEADANYWVLWKVVDDDGDPPAIISDSRTIVPKTNEFGQFRAYLGQQGIDAQELDAVVGGSVNGRNWEQIKEPLIEWLSAR